MKAFKKILGIIIALSILIIIGAAGNLDVGKYSDTTNYLMLAGAFITLISSAIPFIKLESEGY